MRRETLLDFFGDFAGKDGEFFVYDDGFRTRTYTYRQTADAANAFAARLRSAGIGRRDKVLFWSENRPEWIFALWGCLLNGSIAVPIDYRSSRDFLTRVAGIVKAKALLLGDDVEPAFGPGADPVGLQCWKLGVLDWTPPVDGFTAVDATAEDTAEIIFTSGATAEPKGVVLTHRNVLANIIPVEREIAKYRKYGKPFFPLRFLNLLPLSHMFGQAMATFVPPMLPGTVVFMRGFNPHDIVDQIRSRRISVLVSVPKILDVLREYAPRLDQHVGDIPAKKEHVAKRWWRYRRIHRAFGPKFWCFAVGAAPLDRPLEEFWSRLGFLVVQGYGLTETAPIVTLNHPFGTDKGSVGKPIAGVELKIAPDGEIMVRGDNVTTGYYDAPGATSQAFEDGWFHTGDIGEVDSSGRLFIKGRKKEMIVTPEGLNVFPEDIERVVNAVPGVVDSAAVGLARGGQERVHVAAVLQGGADPDQIVRAANAQLSDAQRIRGLSIWPGNELPRTEGTRKIKRHEIRSWLETGNAPAAPDARLDHVEQIVAHFSGGRSIRPTTTIEELGLSSLERVEMMVALEDKLDKHLDEGAFASAATIADLQKLAFAPSEATPAEPVDFPRWNRTWPVRVVRAVSQTLFLLPLARVFAWIQTRGLEHLNDARGPVIFAANHQSHMDTPVILAALPTKWRTRVATAMAKEFFKAHFFPKQFTRKEWFTNSLNYWLSAGFFNTFPLPQREAGARQTLRYVGELLSDNFSVLIFPEGKRTEHGEIRPFRPGIGMMASRLGVPVVPVRLDGVDRVLHHTWKMAKPGHVTVSFGEPLLLSGDDYEELARQVEKAVRKLGD